MVWGTLEMNGLIGCFKYATDKIYFETVHWLVKVYLHIGVTCYFISFSDTTCCAVDASWISGRVSSFWLVQHSGTSSEQVINMFGSTYNHLRIISPITKATPSSFSHNYFFPKRGSLLSFQTQTMSLYVFFFFQWLHEISHIDKNVFVQSEI